MSSSEEVGWYVEVSSDDLEQGDILPGCVVPIVRAPDVAVDDVEVELETRDLIVVTQTCDLAQRKVTSVLLAQVWTWDAIVAERRKGGDASFGSTKSRESLQRGQLPNMCLLHRRNGSPRLGWSVADFHHLYVLPKVYLQRHAGRLGARLRLCPPYKEHFAQSFARYFMRVGLPHDAAAFVSEAK